MTGVARKFTSRTNGMNESHVTSMVGRNMERLLPASRSASVVGVASSGSRLRFIFSPTNV